MKRNVMQDRAFNFWLNASIWRHRSKEPNLTTKVRNRLNRDRNDYACRAIAAAPELFRIEDGPESGVKRVSVVDSIDCDPKHRSMFVQTAALERIKNGMASQEMDRSVDRTSRRSEET